MKKVYTKYLGNISTDIFSLSSLVRKLHILLIIAGSVESMHSNDSANLMS